jgi:hypothetical protein
MGLLPLFDTFQQGSASTAPARRPTPEDTRELAMERAFAHADERFKEEYRAFVLRFAERHETFIAEDCQLLYRDRYDLPQPREWRCTGQIFRQLLKEGLIKRIGFGWSKMRGVPVPMFSKG